MSEPPTAPLPSLFSLTGRTALVTGAASGLGRAIAAGLAQAGAGVVLADLDLAGAGQAADEIVALGGRATARRVDVTDRASVDGLLNAALGEHGPIDVLVNSAGTSVWGAAEQVSAETLTRLLDVNLVGTFHCCQAVGAVMLEQGRGSIVNLASIAGLVAFPGTLAYAVSKGGVVQLTRTLAVEWARRGVRVNALAPSTFDTPLVQRNRARRPEAYEQLLQRIPLGRLGQPEEIVGPTVFLASDASSMVTGHLLAVDGGYLAQ